ncbi:hypothetical protein P7K49_012181 [Saguinus oedipus]|uniref:Uncharacterized protein n=1 Tax=Saguinus oedipus TaxID=9490 RepID=A0ABQ9VUB6_SAGOE|nr:hypothetical protein P7K49_012181 [Saguinus oedipus]
MESPGEGNRLPQDPQPSRQPVPPHSPTGVSALPAVAGAPGKQLRAAAEHSGLARSSQEEGEPQAWTIVQPSRPRDGEHKASRSAGQLQRWAQAWAPFTATPGGLGLACPAHCVSD